MAIGTSKSTITTVKTDHECPRCNKKGFLNFEVKASYFRIAFIPFFNIGKSIFAVCSNCNKITPLYKMPAPLKKAAEKEKRVNQVPVWNFIGLIFVIAFGPSIYSSLTYNPYYDDYYEEYYDEYSDEFSELKELEEALETKDLAVATEIEYIQYPKVGDVYEYMIEDGVYSTMKVADFSDNIIYVKHNIATVNEDSKIYQIDLFKNYPDELTSYSKERIESMFWSDTIYNIYR